MVQKFKRGSRVFITKDLPYSRSHFTKGVEAIVQFTYGQEFNSDDFGSYSLILLRNGIGYDSSAWYDEADLTLVSDDIASGLEIIEKYRYGSKN